MKQPISRRKFLRRAAEIPVLALGAGAVLGQDPSPVAAATALPRVDSLPTGVTRTWIAPQYWSNRLQDWRLHNGRIESLTAAHGGQTVGVLTRWMAAGDVGAAISVRTGTLATGAGFSGFLVGTGANSLDWRAAAIVMGASGDGGGFLATYDSDGHVRFREHTSETDQFAYAELPATARAGPAPVRHLDEDVVLHLEISARGGGLFDLTLTARRFVDGYLLSRAMRSGVDESELVGGISLISTARSGGTTARHWFRELRTGGPKIGVRRHSTGPVLGVLYSLNGSVLKLSAQFMPIGRTDPQRATLQIRAPGTTAWKTVHTVAIGPGCVALFRVGGWDSSRSWQFRVNWAMGTAQHSSYAGTIRRDPQRTSSLTVAVMSCTAHSFRPLNARSSGAPELPGETFLGLYTHSNMYFPNREVATNIARQQPDLLVALGDQYYQNNPTMRDRSHPYLDMLSRWYLWLWSFADLTRSTPTICLVDDHDMDQGNLWGWSGAAAPGGDYRYGGYLMPPTWVNMVQRIQCGHNPDAYDPATVLRGITVYYAAFSYGGVSFAILEDRKFKNTNQFGTDPSGNPLPLPRQLLGPRQESFLKAWTNMHPGQPKICLTQTIFACVQTDPAGAPVSDPDTNGSPVPARRRAVTLLRAAGALILSGDQHLGSLIRHGIDSFTDGPIQFTPPAAGTLFQRWFEPAAVLPNSRGPYTGDYTDGFGNKFRVLAVANPRVSSAEVNAIHDNNIGDRNLKREGYGIVRIDKVNNVYELECWPWDTDPTLPGAAQYAGWPYTGTF